MLVQTKLEHPELYEERLAKVLEKLADDSISEADIRESVETKVQAELLKSNLGKFFG